MPSTRSTRSRSARSLPTRSATAAATASASGAAAAHAGPSNAAPPDDTATAQPDDNEEPQADDDDDVDASPTAPTTTTPTPSPHGELRAAIHSYLLFHAGSSSSSGDADNNSSQANANNELLIAASALERAYPQECIRSAATSRGCTKLIRRFVHHPQLRRELTEAKRDVKQWKEWHDSLRRRQSSIGRSAAAALGATLDGSRGDGPPPPLPPPLPPSAAASEASKEQLTNDVAIAANFGNAFGFGSQRRKAGAVAASVAMARELAATQDAHAAPDGSVVDDGGASPLAKRPRRVRTATEAAAQAARTASASATLAAAVSAANEPNAQAADVVAAVAAAVTAQGDGDLASKAAVVAACTRKRKRKKGSRRSPSGAATAAVAEGSSSKKKRRREAAASSPPAGPAAAAEEEKSGDETDDAEVDERRRDDSTPTATTTTATTTTLPVIDVPEDPMADEGTGSFDECFAQLKHFHSGYGHCRVPNKQYKRLAGWASALRTAYRSYKPPPEQPTEEAEGENGDVNPHRPPRQLAKTQLTPQRIAALNSLGFDWNLRKFTPVPWEQRFTELVDFQRTHGHTRVPRTYKINPKLGDWVHVQRVRKSATDEAKRVNGMTSRVVWKNTGQVKSYLSEEKIAKLEEIGFEWNAEKVKKQSFEERFEALLNFRRANGHTNIFEGADEAEIALGNGNGGATSNDPSKASVSLIRWARLMRRQYHRHLLGKTSQITKPQIKQLQDIGFDLAGCPGGAEELKSRPIKSYRNRGKTRLTWDERYEQLVAFQAEHGHARVPQGYAPNPPLNIWVNEQRRNYRLKNEGKFSRLTDEQQSKLEELGFEFSVAKRRVDGRSSRVQGGGRQSSVGAAAGGINGEYESGGENDRVGYAGIGAGADPWQRYHT